MFLILRAGIRRGDVIVGANDTPVIKNADLFEILRTTHELRLVVIRDSVEIRLNVVADEREG